MESIAHAPKRRVLYVINSLEIGGAEIGLSNLINRGVFEGLDFSVATIWPADRDFLNKNPSLSELYIGSLLPFKSRNFIFIIFAVFSILFLISKIKPDIVISSLAQSSLISRISKLIFRRILLISFEHSERLSSPIAEFLMRITKSFVDAVWADSSVTLDSVQRHYKFGANVRTFVVPLHNLEPYLEAQTPTFGGDGPVLLYVGRLSVEKNLIEGMRAMTLVRPNASSLLHIIGPQNMLSAEIENNSLEGSQFTRFHGPSFDWHREWGGCGVLGFVVSTREGASLSSLQLMAMGFPLVTTAPGEVSKLAEDGVNSWICSSTSAEDIAQAIQRAWADRLNWPEMSRAARETARHYNVSSASHIATASDFLHRFHC